MEYRKAVVIGTGMMGPGIACALAIGGVDATIVSRTAEGARHGYEAARRSLSVLAGNDLLSPEAADRAATRLGSATDLEPAAAQADLVVESIPENMAMKQALLARLEAVVRPETVLASNTSGLSITDMASGCARPERVITTHFWNPPHLMPLVEIVRGAQTAPALAEEMRALWRRCGKVPVLVKQDRPGQLGNRMQMAVVREAVYILQEGIADAEDIELAARLGFGLRLPVYGVLEHQDMVGLEMGHAICDYAARDLNNDPHAPRLYQEKIARGETGARAGRGFLDWSRRDPADSRDRRDRFVIDCLRRGVAG